MAENLAIGCAYEYVPRYTTDIKHGVSRIVNKYPLAINTRVFYQMVSYPEDGIPTPKTSYDTNTVYCILRMPVEGNEDLPTTIDMNTIQIIDGEQTITDYTINQAVSEIDGENYFEYGSSIGSVTYNILYANNVLTPAGTLFDTYCTSLTSDIPIFRTAEEGKHYVETGDFSGAINEDDLITYGQAYMRINYENGILQFQSVYEPHDGEASPFTNATFHVYTGEPASESTFAFEWSDEVLSREVSAFSNLSANNMKAYVTFDFRGETIQSDTITIVEDGSTGGGSFLYNISDESFLLFSVVIDDDISIDRSENNDNDDTVDSDSSTTNGGVTIGNVLTTTYRMTKQNLNSFGSWLWGLDLEQVGLEKVNDNPIENVVSLKAIPFVFTSNETTTGTPKLGNISSGIANNPIENSKLVETVPYSFTVPLPIASIGNKFLNYAPFTKFTLYLPFIGNVQLATNEVMGYKLTVKYSIDLVDGQCTVFVYSNFGKQNTEILIYEGSASCSYDIPLFATNRAAQEYAKISGSNRAAIGLAGSIASGNLFGALQGVQSCLDANTIGMHTSEKGSIGGTSILNQPRKISYHIEFPNFDKPNHFESFKGRPSNKGVKLKDYVDDVAKNKDKRSGILICDPSTKVTGIEHATQFMKDEIDRLLKEGVYIYG